MAALCGDGTGRRSAVFQLSARHPPGDPYGQQCRTPHSSLRKIVKVRGGFPNEETALKLLFLALRQAAKKWRMLIHSWREALNHFTILWPERMPALQRAAS
jgi:hypothetical protein